MPRRKKNGQSPARVPGGLSDGESLGHNTGYRLPQAYDSAMASNVLPGKVISTSAKENIVRSMQEMFSHLDPEVIYIVLSESDFKVENAMDSLLELSVAAEHVAPIPSPVSGFERTAAALLAPHHFSERGPDPGSSKSSRRISSPSSSFMTEELDLLVDQELETLTAQQYVKEDPPFNQYLSATTTLSTFPPSPFPQQVLPELLQFSLKPGSRGPSAEQPCPKGEMVHCISGVSSPHHQLSNLDDETSEGQHSLVDFTHLMTDTPKPPLDLGASGRPSAFQLYKKDDPSLILPDKSGVMSSENIVGGARSKVNMASWNFDSPVFTPRTHGNQGPSFITPVAPPNWPSQPWPRGSPISQAPLKPFATIPKQWAAPAAPQQPALANRFHLEGKVLVLLRGAPGSGKSTVARAFQERNPGGVVLCTDDYFIRNGEYHFDPTLLGEAHGWNHNRAKAAFVSGSNPIIIDNTNLQGWEMRPYVVQALKHNYKVLFREPDTWWKNKPRELERRTKHNVPSETIRRMLNGYERYVTVQSIMGSQMPLEKQRLLLENRSLQPMAYETPCPDLVREPGLKERCKNSHPHLYSSLPDVSSIGQSTEKGMLEGSSHKSTDSLNFQPAGRPMETSENCDKDDDMDLGDLDSELDAQLELNHARRDQRIPDCIVESVVNEEKRGDEIPVAFSESIRQSVRRERPSRRSNFEGMDHADTNQSDDKAMEKEKTKEEETLKVEIGSEKRNKGMPEILDVLGDWSSEGSLQQRQVEKRERHQEGNGKEDGGVSEEANKNAAQTGSDGTEFQRILDLIQTGVSALQTDSSSLSSIPVKELKEEAEAVVRFEESHGNRPDSGERQHNTNRLNSSGLELPDCVLDWKAADSCRVDNLEGNTTEGSTNVSVIGSKTESVELKSTTHTNSLSAITADAVVTLDTTEAKGGGSYNKESEDGTVPGDAGTTERDTNNCTEKENRETRAQLESSHVPELSPSAVCEGSVEAENSAIGGSSQERKQRQGRRSGKLCKLALTFTQNCPASSLKTLECPNSFAQNVISGQNSVNTESESNLNPACNTNAQLNIDLFSKSESEAHLHPSPHLPLVETGCSVQTEPQDFAFLWRLNRQHTSEDKYVTVCSSSSDTTVLSAVSSRFVPELSSAVSAAVAVNPSGHKEVPYRVVHEKGTQVEEKQFGATQDRLENLRTLSRHFKLVSFDTLEDLYDKCQHDLEWTTNLLLDSGERFFRDEEGVEEGDEEEGVEVRDDRDTSNLCGDSGKVLDTRLGCNASSEDAGPTGVVEVIQQSACGTISVSTESSDNTDLHSFGGAASLGTDKTNSDPQLCSVKSFPAEFIQLLSEKGKKCDDSGGVIIEESREEIDDEIASMDEAHRILQAELEEMEREEKQKAEERRHMEERGSRHLDIQSVELKLTTELALQLTELFGPVGVDPGTCSPDDYAVQMDMNLAKLLHQKWKETIQERQRQATFHLLQEGSAPESNVGTQFMDSWNVSRPHVSLRNIIKEEQALQENKEKTRQSRADIDRRDGAALLKENQLYSLFPTIDRHFLQDIFRDNNYCLSQTELFLHSLLDKEPVKTVVAPEAPPSDHRRTASKEREKWQKPPESTMLHYQDTEDPEYEDFRAEASLQKSRQLDNFSKAAEAYKQGRKDVASFYAKQGHLHGQRMKEANHRAAVQIFERVNSSLLPNNILDLHGLHVDEALAHLTKVLQDKITECEQGLCRPQLSVITGRGNHSQGGVARIRPAVINYLTNRHYRFTEPKPGLVLVSLK